MGLTAQFLRYYIRGKRNFILLGLCIQCNFQCIWWNIILVRRNIVSLTLYSKLFDFIYSTVKTIRLSFQLQLFLSFSLSFSLDVASEKIFSTSHKVTLDCSRWNLKSSVDGEKLFRSVPQVGQQESLQFRYRWISKRCRLYIYIYISRTYVYRYLFLCRIIG